MPRKKDIYDLHAELPLSLGERLDKFCTFKGAKRQIIIAAIMKEVMYLEKLKNRK